MNICLPIEKEISLMIDVIDSAVMHGGDAGGAYYSDWFSLETAIGAWIKGKGLEGQYAPNEDSYFSKMQRVSMRDIASSKSRYYIVLCDDEVGRFQECGIVTSRPGVPLQLIENNKSESLMPSFSCPKEKYGFYEIDYRRAEDDKACAFYKNYENGAILVYSVPVDYLKKIETNLDIVDSLVQKAGFFIESFQWGKLVIRNKKDQKCYFSLREAGTVAAPELKQWTNILDESLSEIIGDFLNLCKQIYKILWGNDKS